jgi:hypothetical protein
MTPHYYYEVVGQDIGINPYTYNVSPTRLCIQVLA